MLKKFGLILFFVAAKFFSARTFCIPNTFCRCVFLGGTFRLENCSNSLPDLPLIDSKSSTKIDRIEARRALIRWPKNLCFYSDLKFIDLSESNFDEPKIDGFCLNKVYFLNLSRCALKRIPKIENSLRDLQIFDLSSNRIETIETQSFSSFENVRILLLSENPIRSIDSFEKIFLSARLEQIDLISTENRIRIESKIERDKWIEIEQFWRRTNRSLAIRTNSIDLRSILPSAEHFSSFQQNFLHTIFRTLAKSNFFSVVSTPPCRCDELKHFQRFTDFIENRTDVFLFAKTSTCLMPNGIIHARLFDRRTFNDLNCSHVETVFPKKHQQNRSNKQFHVSFSFISTIFLLLF